MPQENVEIVQRAYEHFNRTGEPDYSVFDPEVVYDVSRRTFDPAVFHGHEGLREFVALIRTQWRSLRLDPQDFVAAEDSVVVPVQIIGVGEESGIETTADAAHLWTFRAGKIVRQTTFQTLAEAPEAAGLSEPQSR